MSVHTSGVPSMGQKCGWFSRREKWKPQEKYNQQQCHDTVINMDRKQHMFMTNPVRLQMCLEYIHIRT